jgi:hypothetical protein
MSERNIFEIAARKKVRFQSSGNYTVEDLWDLPLKSNSRTSLDGIAIGLNKEIKALGEESFVDEKPLGNEILQLKFDIVKHVIAVKQAENAVRAKSEQAREAKQKILGLIAQKQDQELANKSVEELQKLLAEAGE